ncbi:hypothetical protein K469DRAFT_698096 [Zopfia rhizophila CBS 207.26]|uniref:Uncharacterized protein n=1 Tax=Zopfia rhizophila CBS 207.26 TaxID=1314779 RepID=A0A6A6ELV7_9PEZI|nr:hypothetical protein K469DRAFT_698096 [Zopfia rhizophila CBS 207.26]
MRTGMTNRDLPYFGHEEVEEDIPTERGGWDPDGEMVDSSDDGSSVPPSGSPSPPSSPYHLSIVANDPFLNSSCSFEPTSYKEGWSLRIFPRDLPGVKTPPRLETSNEDPIFPFPCSQSNPYSTPPDSPDSFSFPSETDRQSSLMTLPPQVRLKISSFHERSRENGSEILAHFHPLKLLASRNRKREDDSITGKFDQAMHDWAVQIAVLNERLRVFDCRARYAIYAELDETYPIDPYLRNYSRTLRFRHLGAIFFPVANMVWVTDVVASSKTLAAFA